MVWAKNVNTIKSTHKPRQRLFIEDWGKGSGFNNSLNFNKKENDTSTMIVAKNIENMKNVWVKSKLKIIETINQVVNPRNLKIVLIIYTFLDTGLFSISIITLIILIRTKSKTILNCKLKEIT